MSDLNSLWSHHESTSEEYRQAILQGLKSMYTLLKNPPPLPQMPMTIISADLWARIKKEVEDNGSCMDRSK